MTRKPFTLWLLWLAPLLFLGLFYFFPLASILGLSFERGETFAAPFLQMVESASLRRVIGFTFGQAALSTLLTLAIGLPGAYLLARYKFPGKSWLRALTTIPFVLPTLVVAAAFNALLGPRGWINLALVNWLDLPSPPLQFQYSLTGILAAHVFYNTTIVLRTVGDFWSHLDPHLGQAAQALGANPLRRLFQVTLPLLSPAILSAALLVFIFDFTSFGVILVLGGPRFATLEVEIYYQTISLFNLPLAAALSVLQLVCTLGLTVVYARLSQKASRPLSLRPVELTQRPLASRRSRLFAGLLIGFFAVLFVAPLVALAARSVIQLPAGSAPFDGGGARLTLDFYRELSANRRDALFFVPPSTAIGISLAYALLTACLALALGLPAAWALARDPQARLNRWLDPLLMLPLGTSAITLGLGFLVAFAGPPFNWRASPILIPLAHTLVAFPFVVRSLVPALRSIRPRLRQAAAVLGASPAQTLWLVDLPLVGRAVLVAAAFAFTISLGEFGATALVTRPEYPTIPVVIYRFLSQPGALNYGQAMALSTLLALVTGASILAIERLRIAEIGEF
ncbi:MAG: iron ABC transporter permease [Chloroflexi bacterium]|nr:iron ABC transporter permease [Chloroflexota bacterium]